MSRVSSQRRREIITELYQQFHDPKFLVWDPLSVVREFSGSRNQEYVALISALFAFGGVKQIIASVRNAVTRLGLSPTGDEVLGLSSSSLQLRLAGFVHRIYVDQDLVVLTLLYQKSVLVHGSLKNHFLVHHDEGGETIEAGLTGLIRDYKQWALHLDSQPGPHFKHMLNSPEDGSTCKRWLMLLKWFIRNDDGIDLGLWHGAKGLTPAQLLIPLDTHLFRISKTLRLTTKKTANWKCAIEVTRKLKELDPDDPTRFDFSLCRYGMLDTRNLLNPTMTES